MTCQVQQLSECVQHPQHLETVANWIFDQWWSRRCDSAEVVLAWLRSHTQKDKVPYTVVALVEGIPVGSCSVIQDDCVHRPQYSPWVAAVLLSRRCATVASLRPCSRKRQPSPEGLM